MNTKFKIIYIVTIFLIIITSIILCILNRKPIIKLHGDETIYLELNQKYEEPGYEARYIHKDITDKVKIKSNLNNQKIGYYKIEYKVNFGEKTYKKIRNIKVIDSTTPVINLLGSGTIEMCPNDKYTELGFNAFDKFDGDVTSKVESLVEDDTVYYYVENSLGKKTMTERKIVRQDTDEPTIELEGYQSSVLYKGSTYFEPGYKATDNCDGDITDKVQITGNINTN